MIRAWSPARLDTTIFSHGHIDHVFGMGPFEQEASGPAGRRRRVVAHENVPARFDRYMLTAGYNSGINSRQFGVPVRVADGVPVPGRDLPRHARARGRGRALRAPPRARRDGRPHLGVGPRPAGALHGRPDHLGLAERGQPAEGAALRAGMGGALREMAALGAEALLPGHGLPDRGRRQGARQSLTDTADAARAPARRDRAADERRRLARRDPARGHGHPRSCSRSPTCGRSTTSPSSSSATSGGSTAAGTTATPAT